jgi:tetratricopeptide (TPR) repeat protein
MKKILSTFLIILLSFNFIIPPSVAQAAVSPQIADFLCEKGMAYYNLEKYPEALAEFKKALMADPESVVAKEFISTIEVQDSKTGALDEGDSLVKKISSVNSFLDTAQKSIELQGPSSAQKELEQAILAQKSAQHPEKQVRITTVQFPTQTKTPQEEPVEEVVIDVDSALEGKDTLDIDTNIGERLRFVGHNLSRFLVTQPNMLKVSRLGPDELLVEPQDLGTTYMHVWDNRGRKTFRFLIGPRKFAMRLLKEYQERFIEAQRPESFKLSYSIIGASFYTGRGFGDLGRISHSLAYSSSIIGETPFGNFDSAVQANRTPLGRYSVSNLRMGITNGHYDQFKDITIRGFDFAPGFSSFGFPASDLRGILLNAPMSDKKFEYTTFKGALPAGGFTQLPASSGLSKTKQAWLEGVGLNYRPNKFANFKTFYAHSYGPERSEPVLTSDTSGFGMNYHLGLFDVGSEMAYDHTKNISYMTQSSFTLPKFRLGLSTTDNNEHFASLLGGEPAGGSENQTMTINYRPTQDVAIFNSFSRTVDKLFFNPDKPGTPNYNSVTRLNWYADPQTEFELGYTMDDRIGSVSPSVVETKELVFRKKIFIFRKLSTYLTYQNSKSKNFSSPAQDFNNNRIMAGLSMRVLYDIYGYYRREFNLLYSKFSRSRAYPTAQEYGLSFNHQIGHSPFYTTFRIFYRDEQDTESELSFLSGEDRLEGEGEVTYRPNPDSELYLKARVDNVWAEKEGTAKHFDFDLSWGMRLLWDTGFRWQAKGGFQGYVFYDLNGNGVREPKEQGVSGVEVFGSQDKKAVTDAKGYYKIEGLIGKKAVLGLDLKTIPKGYTPTTSVSKEVDIVHAKMKRFDFGLTTQSEISGLVFLDKDGNGKYDAGEKPVNSVVIVLDNDQKAVTSSFGEYMFRKLVPGEHTLKVDLKTVPVKYLPKVPITKTVKVIEGATFVYNIPLEEPKEK